jgi:hypothetical protein
MNPPAYIYREPVQPLREGRYSFQVTDLHGEPYTSRNGNFVLPVQLAVGPDDVTIYDNPSAGVTKTGDKYDDISPFLLCIWRNPKEGERPDLSRGNLVGARGELMLKIAKVRRRGLTQAVIRVARYIWNDPKQERDH